MFQRRWKNLLMLIRHLKLEALDEVMKPGLEGFEDI